MALRYDTTTDLGTATTDGDGVFTITVTVSATIVPGTAIGPHSIHATDSAGVGANRVLHVVAVRLSISRALPGSQVTISGQGFLPNQPLLVRLGGQTVLTGRTIAAGAFADRTFLVPSSVPGQQELLVRSGPPSTAYGSPLATEAATSFTVSQATLLLSPATVSAGHAVAISGTGYAMGTVLTLTLGTTQLGRVTTDANGAFGPVDITVPAETPSGRHTITIHDRGGRTIASATLEVQGQWPHSRSCPARG